MRPAQDFIICSAKHLHPFFCDSHIPTIVLIKHIFVVVANILRLKYSWTMQSCRGPCSDIILEMWKYCGNWWKWMSRNLTQFNISNRQFWMVLNGFVYADDCFYFNFIQTVHLVLYIVCPFNSIWHRMIH